MKPATIVLKKLAQDLEKRQLLKALIALKQGDVSVRLPNDWTDIDGKIADAFNEILDLKRHTVRE